VCLTKRILKNKIEILCPGRNCRKCRRFINYFEKFIADNSIDAEIIVITSLKEFIRFRTWILPSVFINDKKVGRGYIPDEKVIFEALK
jgi:hypothetical protein